MSEMWEFKMEGANQSGTGIYDEWFFDQSGKKIYNKEFLMALRYCPESTIKHDNLLGTITQEDRRTVADINRYPMGRMKDLMPGYVGSSFLSNSCSQGNTPLECNSRQGFIAAMESNETGVELETGKLVQPHIKPPIENYTSVIDAIPSLSNEEGLKQQWSPFNQSGRNICNMEFLMAVYDPKSKRKPDDLFSVTQEGTRKVADNKYPTGRVRDFTPACDGSIVFNNSFSQESVPPKSNGQQVIQFTAPVESYETGVENKRFIQPNAEAIIENDLNVIDTVPSLPIAEDFWSSASAVRQENRMVGEFDRHTESVRTITPRCEGSSTLFMDQSALNHSGNKIYGREFLVALRYSPKSIIKPDNLLDTISREEKKTVSDGSITNEKLFVLNTEATSVIDIVPNFPCKEDQWIPLNEPGKKIYGEEFLMALRCQSKIKPDNLLDAITQEERLDNDIKHLPAYDGTLLLDQGRNIYDREFLMALRYIPTSTNDPDNLLNTIIREERRRVGGDYLIFVDTPSQCNTNHKKVKHNSKKAKKLALSSELLKIENTPTPSSKIVGSNKSDEEYKAQELYRKVRCLLNQLTPQNIDTLICQVRALPIDTAERLECVTNLVFEKALDEPKFLVAYTLLCKELATLQVPVNIKNEEFVNFRELLVKRCDLELGRNSAYQFARNLKMKEIQDCTDPEKKNELEHSLEVEDKKARRKCMGNIGFIGLLFKQQMLTVNFMLRCLNKLLLDNDEECLECLCVFLATMEKDVECVQDPDLIPVFEEIKETVDKMYNELSRKLWFMLQDVILMLNGFVHGNT